MRVNGAEVMPRPQQQQPSSARVLAHSLARFFRSLLFAPVLPLPRNNRRKKRVERGGGKRDSFLLADSLLSLSTLSLPVCSFSLSIAVFLARIIPRPFPSGERATFSLARWSPLFFFLNVVSSHTLETARSFPRTAPITNSR